MELLRPACLLGKLASEVYKETGFHSAAHKILLSAICYLHDQEREEEKKLPPYSPPVYAWGSGYETSENWREQK